jgi:hypothetical protein
VEEATMKLTERMLARGADRLYGDLLILLAAVSAAAPLFDGATLAWALFAAGAAGLWWIALDRSMHGFFAAIGWTLVSLGLGLHLAFHFGVGEISIQVEAAMLGGGFILLGIAEAFLGVERYRGRPAARLALVIGAAVAIAFGIAAQFFLLEMPDWIISTTVAVMMAGFGIGLIVGARRIHRKLTAA